MSKKQVCVASFSGGMLLFSCENRRIKACDSCQKDTLTESCENEQKVEKTHESVFFYYEAGRDATNGYKSQSSLLILSSTEESSVGIPCTWTRPRTSGAAS